MSRASFLPALFLTTVSAVTLVALVLIAPARTLAGEKNQTSSSCVEPSLPPVPGIRILDLPHFDPRDQLTSRDEIAAMAAIQTGLSTAADGATFVWHRRNGRLSAIVRPTATFRDVKGRVCRHLRLLLNSGDYSRSTEGVACRLANRTWSLEG
jgi:hypothetical protein